MVRFAGERAEEEPCVGLTLDEVAEVDVVQQPERLTVNISVDDGEVALIDAAVALAGDAVLKQLVQAVLGRSHAKPRTGTGEAAAIAFDRRFQFLQLVALERLQIGLSSVLGQQGVSFELFSGILPTRHLLTLLLLVQIVVQVQNKKGDEVNGTDEADDERQAVIVDFLHIGHRYAERSQQSNC